MPVPEVLFCHHLWPKGTGSARGGSPTNVFADLFVIMMDVLLPLPAFLVKGAQLLFALVLLVEIGHFEGILTKEYISN